MKQGFVAFLRVHSPNKRKTKYFYIPALLDSVLGFKKGEVWKVIIVERVKK